MSLPTTNSLQLTGIDGTNPLGFLAAVGTLVAARAAGEATVRLRWQRGRTWTPVLAGLSAEDKCHLCDSLDQALRGQPVDETAQHDLDQATRKYEDVKTRIKQELERIRQEGLRGVDRRAAIMARVGPLEQEAQTRRQEWLQALAKAVPRPELSLGNRIDCTADDYRAHAQRFLESGTADDEESLAFLAAFGSDGCVEEGSQENRTSPIKATPFCFIRGSGGQEFLKTVRQLVGKVKAERILRALFEAWRYEDPGHSMRWDPVEDKRYALTDVKPADEGARTVWMANLLAYCGLRLFPCAVTDRGLRATGWSEREETAFTWPLWHQPIGPEAIRTLMQSPDLHQDTPDRRTLRARGIVAVYRARRIRFPPRGSSYKWNFSPAVRVV